MLLDQNHQADVSAITPMPVDRQDDTSVVNTSSSEAVVWYYNNGGAWAAAAAQAAGTVCVGKLTYSGVLNSNGSAIGRKKDTSLSFAAATRVSTLVEIPEDEFSKMLNMTVAEKVAYVIRTGWLDTNGDYAIDHRRGEVWMISKATVANDAATYKYATPLSGGGTGDKVDVIKINGVAPPLDDAVFTPAASPGIVAFGFADEASTDSVAEGDCGAIRMTLDRRMHVTNDPGLSFFFDSDGDNTAQALKAAAGKLYKLHVYNSNAAVAFVQLFDTAAGSVTVGTTAPKYVMLVPSTGGVIEDFDIPLSFGTAITYACTTTPTGNGDPTAGLTVSGAYK